MNVLLPLRYTFFGIFVVCNAIICSAAAWNLGVAQMIGRRMDIDGYLIFLGAVALAFVVVISVIELTRKNALTSRVWFECAWLGVFFVLHLCGAAVLTTFGAGVMCDIELTAQLKDACTSLRLSLASSWTCVVALMLYGLALGISSFVRHKEDPSVWHAPVRDYCWDALCTKLPSSVTGPQPTRQPSIKAPQPRRLALPNLYAHRSRTSGDYDVEQSQVRTQQPVPPVPAIPISRPMRQAMMQPVPPSLYPRHMQSYASNVPTENRPTNETPPPLGNWPRANIVNEPVRQTRRVPPGAAPEPPARPSPQVYVPPPAPRPTGARPTPTRTRNPSSDWRSRVNVPPPLDLSKISSNRPRAVR